MPEQFQPLRLPVTLFSNPGPGFWNWEGGVAGGLGALLLSRVGSEGSRFWSLLLLLLLRGVLLVAVRPG